MNNFLITAMGRSGTKYLQVIMNYSQKWIVKHEPDRSWLPPDYMLKEVQERFNVKSIHHKYYGEVNSTLRYMATKLKVDKKGILIRDPADVWVSIANRRASQTWPYVLGEYERSIQELDVLRKAGACVIDFKQMVNDKAYLMKILKDFGIEDVKINDVIFNTPLNVTEVRIYNTIYEFDSKIIKRIKRLQDIVYPWL